jgi:hypothetical protein
MIYLKDSDIVNEGSHVAKSVIIFEVVEATFAYLPTSKFIHCHVFHLP